MTAIIALAVLGVMLILAELVLPGGIVGVGGTICLCIAIALTFLNYGAMAGAVSFVSVLLFGSLMLALWIKNFRRLPFSRSLVLNEAIDDTSVTEWLGSLVGKEGITLTRIAPSGHADIEGNKIDVMTESGVIERGRPVKIVETRGPTIVVEELPL